MREFNSRFAPNGIIEADPLKFEGNDEEL